MFKWLKDSFATPIMDELKKMTEAEYTLNERGVLPPVVPNRMQCAPNPREMLEAFNVGMELGQHMDEGMDYYTSGNAPTMDQFLNAGYGSLFMVSAQLWKDTKNIQKCMDEQDVKHEAEMKEYIEQVKEVAKEAEKEAPKEKPWSEYTVLERHQARNKEQQYADWRQTNDKRHQRGQTVITWWEYETMTLKNIDPLSPSGLNNVENSVLCPHGRGGSGVPGGGDRDCSGGNDNDSGGYSNGGGGDGGDRDLMNIVIDGAGCTWESNSDGTKSCKM